MNIWRSNTVASQGVSLSAAAGVVLLRTDGNRRPTTVLKNTSPSKWVWPPVLKTVGSKVAGRQEYICYRPHAGVADAGCQVHIHVRSSLLQ